jgi:hypothetical protein
MGFRAPVTMQSAAMCGKFPESFELNEDYYCIQYVS